MVRYAVGTTAKPKIARDRLTTNACSCILFGMQSAAHDRAVLGRQPATPAQLVGPDGPAVVRTKADEVSVALRELAGQIHAANAELVALLSRFDALGGWHGIGIRSLGHWASIHLGIDVRTAAHQTQVGHRLAALPAIAAAAAAGELGWSKLQLVARVAEPASEAKWLGLAREMAVGQLAPSGRAKPGEHAGGRPG